MPPPKEKQNENACAVDHPANRATNAAITSLLDMLPCYINRYGVSSARVSTFDTIPSASSTNG
ncbi:MAG: hypothetical protein KAJ06_04540, partial [Gammaproteobacteria bacterium]|nr:hypothetical protein [Gammaproteobacteria bacterium]